MKSEPKAFASLSSGLLARKGTARPAMRPQGFNGGGAGSGLDDLGWNDMGYDSPRPALVPIEGDQPHVSRNPLAGLTPISPVHDQQAEIEHRFTSYDGEEDSEAGDEEEAEELSSLSFASLTSAAAAPVAVNEEEDTLELSYAVDAYENEDGEDPVGEAMPPAMSVDAYAPLVPFASPPREMETEVEPVAKAAPMPAPAPVLAPEPVIRPARKQSVRSEPIAKGKAAFTLRLDPSRHLKLRLACAVTGKSAQQLVTQALDELLASMPELDAMAERAPAERVSRKG